MFMVMKQPCPPLLKDILVSGAREKSVGTRCEALFEIFLAAIDDVTGQNWRKWLHSVSIQSHTEFFFSALETTRQFFFSLPQTYQTLLSSKSPPLPL